MGIVLAFTLPAVLFLALEWLWCWRPSRSRLLTRAARAGPADASLPLYWDPFALPSVRRQLRVVAAELERLDRDHSIYARAFRTRVAQSAYEALRADESRLAAATIELELVASLVPLREELEL